MARARRARPRLHGVPGLGGGVGAGALDHAGRDGLRAARPVAVPARLAGDPRRSDAVLFIARPGTRRAPAERVRARHRPRRATGSPGARDVACCGTRVLVGAVARVARLGAGRGCAGGRGSGPHLCRADDERGPLLSAARARGVGARGGGRAADPADAGAAGRRGAGGVRDARPGDRVASGRSDGSGRRRVAREVVGEPATAVAGGGGARRAGGCLDRVPARLGLGDARRLRGDHDHVVEHRRGGEVRRLPPRLGADPLRAVPVGGGGGAPRARGAQRGTEPARARVPGRRVVADRLARAGGRRLHLPLLGPDRRAEPDRARAGALPRARAVDRPGRAGVAAGAGRRRGGGRARARRPAGAASRRRSWHRTTR